MNEVIPEGGLPAGGEKVELTKAEFDELVKAKAEKAQNEARMAAELADQRKKIRELTEQGQVQPVDLSEAVQKELNKREGETVKAAQAKALERFLSSHPELSQDDKDGLRLAAFQRALSRMNVVGVKTEDEYESILEDALRLTEEVKPKLSHQDFSSTPRVTVTVPGVKNPVQLNSNEAKLIERDFGGDVERYLKLKAKRPEYVEELLRWVR